MGITQACSIGCAEKQQRGTAIACTGTGCICMLRKLCFRCLEATWRMYDVSLRTPRPQLL